MQKQMTELAVVKYTTATGGSLQRVHLHHTWSQKELCNDDHLLCLCYLNQYGQAGNIHLSRISSLPVWFRLPRVPGT